MKKQFLILFFASALLFACKNDKKAADTSTPTQTEDTESADGKSIPLNDEKSEVYWKATKATGDSHEGTINFQGGSFLVKDNQLVGGEFVIDMTSARNTDIQDQEQNAKLIGHLISPDFFDVEKYPTSKFKILEVDAGEEEGQVSITGTMTIKDVSKNITVPATVTINGDSVHLTSEFGLDRTDFGVVYGSAKSLVDLAKDKVINDIIDYKIDANS